VPSVYAVQYTIFGITIHLQHVQPICAGQPWLPSGYCTTCCQELVASQWNQFTENVWTFRITPSYAVFVLRKVAKESCRASLLRLCAACPLTLRVCALFFSSLVLYGNMNHVPRTTWHFPARTTRNPRTTRKSRFSQHMLRSCIVFFMDAPRLLRRT
jgi:hypothetical protein